jgi:hypothetical protein
MGPSPERSTSAVYCREKKKSCAGPASQFKKKKKFARRPAINFFLIATRSTSSKNFFVGQFVSRQLFFFPGGGLGGFKFFFVEDRPLTNFFFGRQREFVS